MKRVKNCIIKASSVKLVVMDIGMDTRGRKMIFPPWAVVILAGYGYFMMFIGMYLVLRNLSQDAKNQQG